jgi:hypothetical protein
VFGVPYIYQASVAVLQPNEIIGDVVLLAAGVARPQQRHRLRRDTHYARIEVGRQLSVTEVAKIIRTSTGWLSWSRPE